MERTFIRKHARRAIIALQKGVGLRPRNFCLVTGPPRSGTSALRRWLRGQRGVAVFGERRILIALHRFVGEVDRFRKLKEEEEALLAMARRLFYDYYAHTGILLGRSVLIEKEPLEPIAFPDRQYKPFLENTRKVLPHAKLLFMIRDPMATVWSMTQRDWGISLTRGVRQTYSLEEHLENWCTCAELILDYVDDPNTYICSFGRLVADPVQESNRIFDFLEVPRGRPFQPQPTKESQFTDPERDLIVQTTQPYLERLRGQGISDL